MGKAEARRRKAESDGDKGAKGQRDRDGGRKGAREAEMLDANREIASCYAA
jgi:hypothetical protein